MILHVGSTNTFIGPLRKLIKSEFPQQVHHFWLIASKDRHGIEKAPDVSIGEGNFFRICKAYVELACRLYSAQKVILHGLSNPRVVLLLALMPWLMPKCYWIIMGADLYQYKTSKTSWRARIKEPFRRLVIRKVGHLVTYIEGDAELARLWYGAKGKYLECIMYLSNVADPRLTAEVPRNIEKRGINILLGNSADPANNHIEVLERLLAYNDQDIKIYAPLSYGGQNHAKKVIAQGQEWFGDKFVPMMDFVPFEQYLQFLKSLDIVIFNHRLQQAMGNTITLLGMGKTVFIRSDVNQWQFFNDLGIKLNDVKDLTLKPLKREDAKKNARIVHTYFSKATLIKQLSDIFEGKDGLSDKRNITSHGVQGRRYECEDQ